MRALKPAPSHGVQWGFWHQEAYKWVDTRGPLLPAPFNLRSVQNPFRGVRAEKRVWGGIHPAVPSAWNTQGCFTNKASDELTQRTETLLNTHSGRRFPPRRKAN